MIVDVHTHRLQPDHVSPAAQSEMEKVGYPPMQPLTFDQYAREMKAVDRAIVFGARACPVG